MERKRKGGHGGKRAGAGQKRRFTIEQVVKALQRNRGLLRLTARYLDCPYWTLISYVRRFPEIAAAVSHEREYFKDKAEMILYKKVERGNNWALGFYLKNVARDRGYANEHAPPSDPTTATDADPPGAPVVPGSGPPVPVGPDVLREALLEMERLGYIQITARGKDCLLAAEPALVEREEREVEAVEVRPSGNGQGNGNGHKPPPKSELTLDDLP